MDLLAEVLDVSGVRGAVGACIEASQDWGWWWTSPTPKTALHAVTSGTAWLGLPDRAPLQLLPGDVVLLPSGVAHAIGSDPQALARTTATQSDGWRRTESGAVAIGTGPVQTHVLCADYAHDRTISTQILSLLPELVHVRRGTDDGLIEGTVRMLGHELARPGPATGVVLDRLVDVLLVQILRTWLATGQLTEATWLGALHDDIVAAAVSRMHAEPARSWSATALADEVGVSRATLARRFAIATGASPGAYLERWRMDLATRRLCDTDDSLDAIAASVGYSSAYAFSRAFRRARALPPGRFRAAHRLEGSASPSPART